MNPKFDLTKYEDYSYHQSRLKRARSTLPKTLNSKTISQHHEAAKSKKLEFATSFKLNDFTIEEKNEKASIPIYLSLKVNGLQQYTTYFIQNGFGYDLKALASLDSSGLFELIENCKFLPGHKERFLKMLEQLQKTYQINGKNDNLREASRKVSKFGRQILSAKKPESVKRKLENNLKVENSAKKNDSNLQKEQKLKIESEKKFSLASFNVYENMKRLNLKQLKNEMKTRDCGLESQKPIKKVENSQNYFLKTINSSKFDLKIEASIPLKNSSQNLERLSPEEQKNNTFKSQKSNQKTENKLLKIDKEKNSEEKLAQNLKITPHSNFKPENKNCETLNSSSNYDGVISGPPFPTIFSRQYSLQESTFLQAPENELKEFQEFHEIDFVFKSVAMLVTGLFKTHYFDKINQKDADSILAIKYKSFTSKILLKYSQSSNTSKEEIVNTSFKPFEEKSEGINGAKNSTNLYSNQSSKKIGKKTQNLSIIQETEADLFANNSLSEIQFHEKLRKTEIENLNTRKMHRNDLDVILNEESVEGLLRQLHSKCPLNRRNLIFTLVVLHLIFSSENVELVFFHWSVLLTAAVFYEYEKLTTDFVFDEQIFVEFENQRLVFIKNEIRDVRDQIKAEIDSLFGTFKNSFSVISELFEEEINRLEI